MNKSIKEVISALQVVLQHCDGGEPGKVVALGGSAMYESLLSELDCLIMLLGEGYGIVSRELEDALNKNRRMELAMHSEGELKILKRLFARAVRYTDANSFEKIIKKYFSQYSMKDAMGDFFQKSKLNGLEDERLKVVDVKTANLILEVLSKKDALNWLKHAPVSLPKYVGSVSYSAMISYAIKMNSSVEVVGLILEQDPVYDMAAIFSCCAEFGRYDILDVILRKEGSPLKSLASTDVDTSKMDFNNVSYLARKYGFLQLRGVMLEPTVEPTKEVFEWVLRNIAPQAISIDLMRLKRVIKENIDEAMYGLSIERTKEFIKEIERYQLVVVAGAENEMKKCPSAL